MCELMAMSANVPTDICFSFAGLMERGGRTGPHKDGWGVTFYEGKACRTFKDPLPSCESEIARLVKDYPIKSCSVIAHIRQANRGSVCLANTHPFVRPLWGRNWTFAHNGQLSNYQEVLQVSIHEPIGETDSELAFCWLLDQLKRQFSVQPDDMKSAFLYVASIAHTLKALGIFNMLLTDGIYTLAYCTNNLHWITRRAPFGKASLIDSDWVIDFQEETTEHDIVTIIATQPLTDNEQWHKMQEGEFALFHLGEKVETSGES